MSRVRIAVTGIGLVTPLGIDRETSWSNLLAGQTAARWLTSDELAPAVPATPWYGAPVTVPESPLSHLSRTSQFALIAARDALEQAQVSAGDLKSLGCVIGTSKTDLREVDRLFQQLSYRDAEVLSPTINALFPSDPAQAIAAEFGLQGGVLCPVAACATGLVSVIRAAEMIRHGDLQAVLAGSTDSSLHPGLLASYRRLGVLAAPGTDPATACRPFDVQRTGFVVGEGAAVLILEEWEAALSRGATLIAEWVDGQLASDPSGLTAVDSSGQTLARLISNLLDRNRVSSDQVSAICYHGTATHMNDLTEARAVAESLSQRPVGFAVKGAIGHLMGAAGAVETAFSLLSLRDQLLPPTVNHTEHDPDCPNRLTGADAMRQPIEYLLKTSLGFGGHLAVGLLKRVSGPPDC